MKLIRISSLRYALNCNRSAGVQKITLNHSGRKMHNPYESPKTKQDLVKLSKLNSILRWIACLVLGYMALMPLLVDSMPLSAKLFGASLHLFLAVGVIRRGRAFHLGVAIFMLIKMATQAYFMNRAIMNMNFISESFPSDPWLFFAKSVIPHAIILVCTAALYLRSKSNNL